MKKPIKEQDANNILSLELIVTYVMKKPQYVNQRSRCKLISYPRINSNICHEKVET